MEEEPEGGKKKIELPSAVLLLVTKCPLIQHNDNIFVLSVKGLNLKGSNQISHKNVSYTLSYTKLKALNEQY